MSLFDDIIAQPSDADMSIDLMDSGDTPEDIARRAKWDAQRVPGPAWPNLADSIWGYLKTHFPELARVTYRPGQSYDQSTRVLVLWGTWVTGSRIWRHVYNIEPDPAADWDVFVSNRYEMAAVRALLEKLKVDPPSGTSKDKTSLGGEIHYTTRGRVDLWLSPYGPYRQLESYPASHRHCRVAFNPALRATIVLPTFASYEGPTDHDRFEQHERLTQYHAESAVRLKP